MTTFRCEFSANNKDEVENWKNIEREGKWNVSLLGTVRTMAPLVIGGKEKFSPKYLLDYLKDGGTEKDIKSSIFMCEERRQEDFDCKISVGRYNPEVISKEVLTLHFDKDGKYTGYDEPKDSAAASDSSTTAYEAIFGTDDKGYTYWYVYNGKNELKGVIWDNKRACPLQASWPVPAICKNLCVKDTNQNVVNSVSGDVVFYYNNGTRGNGTLKNGEFGSIKNTDNGSETMFKLSVLKKFKDTTNSVSVSSILSLSTTGFENIASLKSNLISSRYIDKNNELTNNGKELLKTCDLGSETWKAVAQVSSSYSVEAYVLLYLLAKEEGGIKAGTNSTDETGKNGLEAEDSGYSQTADDIKLTAKLENNSWCVYGPKQGPFEPKGHFEGFICDSSQNMCKLDFSFNNIVLNFEKGRYVVTNGNSNEVSSLSDKVAFKCGKRVLGTGTLEDGRFSKIESTQKIEDVGSWDEASKTFTFSDKITEISKNEIDLVPAKAENLIGEKVTTIGEFAFYKRPSRLMSVKFPNAKTIGEGAFYGCTGLSEVEFPNAKTIGEYAFEQCASLMSVEFSNAKTIGEGAFCGCKSLAEVEFPDAETIEKGAFYQCTGLVSLSFLNAKTIGNSAFEQCASLAEVKFSNAKTIGKYAFYQCASLAEVKFPEATAIKGFAFGGCANLIKVTIPNEAVIMADAFEECKKLEAEAKNEIKIEDGVVKLTTLSLQIICGNKHIEGIPLKNMNLKEIKLEIGLEERCIYNNEENELKLKGVPRPLRGAFERLFINQDFIKNYKRTVQYTDDKFKKEYRPPIDEKSKADDFSNFEFGEKQNNVPLYPNGEPCMDDINQNDVGDCWFLSALSSLVSTNPEKIKNNILKDNGDGTVTVTLRRCVLLSSKYDESSGFIEEEYGPGSTIEIKIDKSVANNVFNLNNALWVRMIEKAMAVYLYKGYDLMNRKTKQIGKEGVSIPKALNGNLSAVAGVALTGKNFKLKYSALRTTATAATVKRQDEIGSSDSQTKPQGNSSSENLMNEICKKIETSDDILISTTNSAGSIGLVPGHAHSVLGVILPRREVIMQKESNELTKYVCDTFKDEILVDRQFVILRNPWGSNSADMLMVSPYEKAKEMNKKGKGLVVIEVSYLDDPKYFGSMTYSDSKSMDSDAVDKDLKKLFEVAKSLKLVKEDKTNDTISLARYSSPKEAVENFLYNLEDSSEKTKALNKIRKASTLEEQLDILKRFLLRQKRKKEKKEKAKKKSIIKRAAHKVKKVLLGDKSEARKVKKCFTEVGKCIKDNKLGKLEEKMKISGWAGWNNINGDLLGKYSGADEKLQVVFMSFIGLKNAKNVIAACDGLKEGGVKGNNDPYVKIRKAIKAECLDENLTQDNLERCIIESFCRYYPSKGAQTVVEVFNCIKCIKKKYKGISWDEPTE